MPSTILSDNGVTSGTAGIKTTGSNDGSLALQTTTAGGAATTALTIDTSQNVGVGVTPSAWSSSKSALEVGLVGNGLFGLSQTAGYVTTNNYYNSGWKYAGTGAASLYEKSGTAHRLYSADSGTAGNAITWTQIFEVNKGKSLALEGASAQTGTGITFPATQSASSDANTLDDYEEGTFTPTITGSTVAGTPVNGEGFYTKIGRVVYVSIRFENVAPPSGGSGNIQCNNLPFVVTTSLTSYNYAGVGLLVFFSGSSIANTYQSVRVQEGNNFFRIQYSTNINSDATNLTIANMGASSNYIRVTFFYFN